MRTPSFSVVIGLDENTIKQAKVTVPNWLRIKPGLHDVPWVVFFDYATVQKHELQFLADLIPDLQLISYGLGVSWEGDESSKWYRPQRYKMLSGFIHATAEYVSTDYWLKLDTDTVATHSDRWINPEWFEGTPAIISHPWGYTKPADQMDLLDAWADRYKFEEFIEPPLNLHPNEGSSLVRHKRIISWCGFFNTRFTQLCSLLASSTCGPLQLPVPSQDGFMWYCAKRMGLPISRTNMKERGWAHHSRMRSIQSQIKEVNAAHGSH